MKKTAQMTANDVYIKPSDNDERSDKQTGN